MEHIRPPGSGPPGGSAPGATGANPADEPLQGQRARSRHGDSGHGLTTRVSLADVPRPPRAAPLHAQLGLPAPGVLARAVARTGTGDLVDALAQRLDETVVPVSVLAAAAATLTAGAAGVRVAGPTPETQGGIVGNSFKDAAVLAGTLAVGAAVGAAALRSLSAARNFFAQLRIDALAGPVFDSGGIDRTSDVERLIEHLFARTAEDSLEMLRAALGRSIAEPEWRAALADLAGNPDGRAVARAALTLTNIAEFYAAIQRAMPPVNLHDLGLHELQAALDERAGMFGAQASLSQGTYVEASNLLQEVYAAASPTVAIAQLLLAIRRDAATGIDGEDRSVQARVLDQYIEMATGAVDVRDRQARRPD
jgi:hypothetical protein